MAAAPRPPRFHPCNQEGWWPRDGCERGEGWGLAGWDSAAVVAAADTPNCHQAQRQKQQQGSRRTVPCSRRLRG